MSLGAAALALAVAVTSVLAPGAPAGAAPPSPAHGALVSTNPLDTTAHVLDGRTEAVLDLGDRVIVGGTFTRVKRYSQPAQFARSYLFAYDKATGAIDTRFLPQPNGRVSALLRAADGSVLVSGQFTSIGGRNVPYLAKVDPVTGAASSTFAPRPNGMVYDLHQANGLVYLGGTFTRVGNATRTNFAVVEPTTGAVRGADVAFTSAPRGTTRLMRFDITPDGRTLVGIGNFARVGGQVRENIAVLSLTSGGGATVAGWRTDRYEDLTCGSRASSWDTPTYDVDLSPDGSWFVVVTTGGPGGTTRLCDTAVRWETGAPGAATPTWVNWTGGDSLTSVAVTGAAVYVAGHQRWMDNPQGRDSKGAGAVDRQGIAALSPTTGRALSWNPGRERGLVAPRLVATPQGLYVLSDSSAFAGEWHPRLTFLPLPGTTPSTPTAPGTPSVTASTVTSATLGWAAPASGPAVTGYTVTVRAGASVVATKDAGTARSTTVTGLPAARALTFTVAARTATGTSPTSAASAAAVLPFRTVDAFTTQQHRDLLGRAPTAAELADWRSRVGGGSVTPAVAVDQLLGSASVGRLASVSRLYQAYFRRLPDAGGFRYWRDRVRAGTSLEQVSRSFAAAPELTSTYGRLDDGQFVDLVYRNVLGRSPDRDGRAYWVGRLRAGVSRGKVMIGFSESPENKATTAATTDVVLVVHLLLDRAPTSAERGRSAVRRDHVQTVLVSAEYDARA